MTLTISMCCVSNAEENTPLDENTIQLLKNLGFDDTEIQLMPTSEIDIYKTVTKMSSQEKYYRVDDEGTTENNIVLSSTSLENKGVTELTKEEFETELAQIDSNENNHQLLSGGDYDEQISNSGYLKARVSLYVLSDGNVKVTYIATWVKKPSNTKIDVCGAITDAGTLIHDSPTFYYSCTRKTYEEGRLTKTEVLKETTQNDKMELTRGSAGCALSRNLKDDTINYTPLKNGKEFSNHKLYLSYTVTYNNKSQISASGHYFHQESSIQISPSVSVGYPPTTGGAGLSLSHSEKMNHIKPNPYIDLKYSDYAN